MLVHNIVTRAPRIPEFCLSTTSENHTINRIRSTDKTTHNQPGKMSPHLKRPKYHEITLSLSLSTTPSWPHKSSSHVNFPGTVDLFKILHVHKRL